MTQEPGGGGGGVGVDWDAVFRTIDHQQSQQQQQTRAEDVAPGPGGTLQSGEYVQLPVPWATGAASRGPRHVHGNGVGEEEEQRANVELLEYFAGQWDNQGGHSNSHPRRGIGTGTGNGTMDPGLAQGHSHGLEGKDTRRPTTSHPEHYDLAFRAMLGDEQDNQGSGQGLVPPPQDPPLRHRRRSRSLGLGFSSGQGLAGLNALSGPITSYPTLPSHDPFPQNQLRPLQFGVAPNSLHSNPDVYPFFPQLNSGTGEPYTPAPTPLYPVAQPYSRPSTSHRRGTKRPSTSTSAGGSRRQTPSSSTHPSPQAGQASLNAATSSNDPGNGSGNDGTAEGDSEDKRARNTQASARFRAKRKAHINEVERQITQLEGQSTLLSQQVEDLRKENVFLKDMVQLKYGLDVDNRI